MSNKCFCFFLSSLADFSQNESDCFVLLLLLLSAADCHTQRGQCKTQPQPSFKEKVSPFIMNGSEKQLVRTLE